MNQPTHYSPRGAFVWRLEQDDMRVSFNKRVKHEDDCSLIKRVFSHSHVCSPPKSFSSAHLDTRGFEMIKNQE